MKLTGKVVKVESASQFIDKVERIHIRINEADNMFCELRLRNLAHLMLDEELNLEVIKHRDLDSQLAEAILSRGAEMGIERD